MKPIDTNGGIKIGYSITIGGKKKKRTPKEAQLETLRWKLKFHQEQAERTLKQIKLLESEK